MTPEDIIAAFERYEETDYIKFDRVVNPPSMRPDLCAFLILDRLCPGVTDMVSAAEHDEIYLSPGIDAISQGITDADILTLVRCGVMYHEEFECLYMFA